MEEEEEANWKSARRVAPFIAMIGRAALPGDEDCQESRGTGVSTRSRRERLAHSVPCHEPIKDEHDPARSAHTTLRRRPMWREGFNGQEASPGQWLLPPSRGPVRRVPVEVASRRSMCSVCTSTSRRPPSITSSSTSTLAERDPPGIDWRQAGTGVGGTRPASIGAMASTASAMMMVGRRRF